MNTWSLRSGLGLPSRSRFRKHHLEVNYGSGIHRNSDWLFPRRRTGRPHRSLEREGRRYFRCQDQPLTEDQVRAKLQSDGWTAVQVSRDERYIEATASKDGRVARLMIDSLTGKLIADDRDED